MRKRKLIVIIAVIIAAMVAAVVITTFIESDKAMTSAGQSQPSQDTADISTGENRTWLRFEGTDIDDPVMQAEDNEYYLRLNEYGEPDVWGCYFMDYECSPSSRNIIIYGHSNGDNIDDLRFSQLKRLNDEEFAEKHNIIELEINGETRKYQIFSSGYANALTDHVILTADPDRETMQEIIDMALDRSRHDYSLEVSADDDILTLSTCTTDETTRYVVVVKLV